MSRHDRAASSSDLAIRAFALCRKDSYSRKAVAAAEAASMTHRARSRDLRERTAIASPTAPKFPAPLSQQRLRALPYLARQFARRLGLRQRGRLPGPGLDAVGVAVFRRALAHRLGQP